MLFAAIDIGSNAVRLLFANVFEMENHIHVDKATLTRIPVRLGKDVFDKQKITQRRAEDLIKTLQAYKLLIDVYKPLAFEACATSAMREAANGKGVIKKIRQETGIKVKIIDGQEEAAILRSLDIWQLEPDERIRMYIDVGGGSTEISVTKNDKVLGSESFKLGTIRILEHKEKKSEWDSMLNWLARFRHHPEGLVCIGSGGNINKINKLFGDQVQMTLDIERLRYAYDYLRGFSISDRVDLLGLRLDRADVIVPAARIYLTIMETAGVSSIYVPKVGLADGMIYNLYKRYKNGSV
jgi:exopolyphosphatase/guanosine-5'-triphosphate,3'-diphosphate pyrophosphatase